MFDLKNEFNHKSKIFWFLQESYAPYSHILSCYPEHRSLPFLCIKLLSKFLSWCYAWATVFFSTFSWSHILPIQFPPLLYPLHGTMLCTLVSPSHSPQLDALKSHSFILSSSSNTIISWKSLCTLSSFSLHTLFLNWTFIKPSNFISISIRWCCNTASSPEIVFTLQRYLLSQSKILRPLLHTHRSLVQQAQSSIHKEPPSQPSLFCLPSHIQHFRMYLSLAGFVQLVAHSWRSH